MFCAKVIVSLRKFLVSSSRFSVIPWTDDDRSIPLFCRHQLSKRTGLKKSRKLVNLDITLLKHVNVRDRRDCEIRFLAPENRILIIPAHVRKKQGLHKRHIMSILILLICLVCLISVRICIHRLDLLVCKKLFFRLLSCRFCRTGHTMNTARRDCGNSVDVVLIIEVCVCNNRSDAFQNRARLRLSHCRCKLNQSLVGTAKRARLTIAPLLLSNPVENRGRILTVLNTCKAVVHTVGDTASSHLCDDSDISIRDTVIKNLIPVHLALSIAPSSREADNCRKFLLRRLPVLVHRQNHIHCQFRPIIFGNI